MALNLDVTGLKGDERATGTWAATLLVGLAREEVAGRRPARLTEPGLPTWQRFRGRLRTADFVELLFEDAAVLHPVPFDPSTLDDGLRFNWLSEHLVERWLRALPDLDLRAPGADHVMEHARLLQLPTRLGRSDLPVVKPHHKVLELPGTGGQLVHHLLTTQPELSLRDNVVVACNTWQEMTMAGLVALDLGAADTRFIVKVTLGDQAPGNRPQGSLDFSPEISDLRNSGHPLRQRSFDFVFGLHPDKGGLFRVEDQLAIWFSGARIQLV